MTKHRSLLGLLPLALIGLATIRAAGSTRSLRRRWIHRQLTAGPAAQPTCARRSFNLAQRIGRPVAYLGEPMLNYQTWPRLGVSPDRLAPAGAISRFPGPVPVIGGPAVRSTPVAETRALHGAAAEQKALRLLGGVDLAAAGAVWTGEFRERIGILSLQMLGDPRAGPPARISAMARSR